MRKRWFVAVSILGLFALPAANADESRFLDGNDAPGPLDIRSVAHSHQVNERGVAQLVHTVRLYERWPVHRLTHRGYINLFFDLPGNEGWHEERAVYISYEGGRLRAEMIDQSVDPPQPMGSVPLRRPNPRTVKVLLRELHLGPGVSSYRWNAVSYVEARHNLCGRAGGCSDITASLRHDL